MAEDGDIALPQFVSFTKAWHNKAYDYISPDRPELSMADKNVVVVGGGTGIGRATAIAFAQAGASSVSILGRRIDRLQSAAQEIREAGPKTQVITESADFSKRDAAEAGLKKVAQQIGTIDIFVWSAGISPHIAEIQGYDVEELVRGFDLIVASAFNAIQALMPLAVPDVKIFNVSTGIAHMKPIKGLFNYATAKLAAVKLFDYLAAENSSLHVVHIQPGVVETELNAATGVGGQDEPELPAQFTVWLATPEAKFLAGRFVWANWDVEELLARRNEIEKSMLLRVHLEGVAM